MTRIVFAGPSLYGIAHPNGLTIAPPAAQRDLISAVEAGATHIGLVDGYFGSCASVWHKEILYALSNGCQVFGAASMGALRAAECWQFGMIPVGSIAHAYIAGDLTDDADVALLHGPAEFDFIPFTEPLVDVRATIECLKRNGSISAAESIEMLAIAQSIHFSARDLDTLFAGCSFEIARGLEIRALYEAHVVRTKQHDACLLLAEMLKNNEKKSAGDWTLSQSAALLGLLEAR
ncbi:TfuA-like protein [Devosia sp. Leaf64]|uniref:TfuA-like protein n=1 Tax=Devosia sp. Leaf64 TaxID=1736229 RepID=UPI0007129D44|nr:TfuA-like protein [Devosia sp. Leaf64]KQN75207.1 hypothetical protein ASE94_02500 [Devosia sp. Leaf64]